MPIIAMKPTIAEPSTIAESPIPRSRMHRYFRPRETRQITQIQAAASTSPAKSSTHEALALSIEVSGSTSPAPFAAASLRTAKSRIIPQEGEHHQ